jgi:hypothetical protein
MWLPVELLALKRIATTSDLKTFKVPQAELETHPQSILSTTWNLNTAIIACLAENDKSVEMVAIL